MRLRTLGTALAVALVAAAWTVTAAAENPHGTPPGQQQASGSVVATASVHANARAQVHGRAQAKGHVAAGVKARGHAGVRAHTTAHTSAATSASAHVKAQAGTSIGVAPSNVTFHNTTAAATSNATKLYGNGTTAGQIAIKAGFGSATLYGPGNSQPHKTTCGVHRVDVHALKAHAAACTAPGTTAGVAAGVSSAAAAQVAAKGGVRGAQVSHSKQSSHAGAVQAARAKLASVTKPVSRALLATARKGTLPFTGLGLWLPIALGLVLIAGGYGLRRKAGALS